MKKYLLRSLPALICSVFIITPFSVSGKNPEPNPFASYFKRVERAEKKIKDLEGGNSKSKKKKPSKQDKKKLESLNKQLTKAKETLAKKVEDTKKAVDKKIALLEKRIQQEESAGKDVTFMLKQRHKLQYQLIKIDAWAKNEAPPAEEPFKAEEQVSSSDDGGGSSDSSSGDSSSSGGGFDADAFQKQLEGE